MAICALPHTDKNGRCIWKCLCECGNYVNVRSGNLTSGNSKSCGCLNNTLRAEDLSGMNTDMLSVLYRDGDKKPVRWMCECRCGKTVSVLASKLKSGQKSCGCFGKSTVPNRTQRQMDKSKLNRWSSTVLNLNEYMCAMCGELGGRLEAHHLDSYATHEDRRFTVDNGVPLCLKCHRSFHSRHGNNTTVEDFLLDIQAPHADRDIIDMDIDLAAKEVITKYPEIGIAVLFKDLEKAVWYIQRRIDFLKGGVK